MHGVYRWADMRCPRLNMYSEFLCRIECLRLLQGCVFTICFEVDSVTRRDVFIPKVGKSPQFERGTTANWINIDAYVMSGCIWMLGYKRLGPSSCQYNLSDSDSQASTALAEPQRKQASHEALVPSQTTARPNRHSGLSEMLKH